RCYRDWSSDVCSSDLEISHLVEDGVNLGHDILSVHNNGRVFRSPQCHVQYGTVLGDIDFFSAEHGIDSRLQAALSGQLKEQIEQIGRATCREREELCG